MYCLEMGVARKFLLEEGWSLIEEMKIFQKRGALQERNREKNSEGGLWPWKKCLNRFDIRFQVKKKYYLPKKGSDSLAEVFWK